MHFYDRDGTPRYEVPNASKPGEMRPATVRDARKNGWLPGVTDILKIVDDPGLTIWKINTHIQAALTEPRDGRALDDMIPSIKANAEEFSRVARDKGTAIHDAIEAYTRGEHVERPDVPPETMEQFAMWYADHGCQPDPGGIERSFACEYGYAGRIDFVGTVEGMQTVIDWKTQGTKPGEPFKFYPKWGAQLAAYARGIELPIDDTRLVSVVLSTTEPGRIDAKTWPNNRELLNAFFAAFEVYKGPLGKSFNPVGL